MAVAAVVASEVRQGAVAASAVVVVVSEAHQVAASEVHRAAASGAHQVVASGAHRAAAVHRPNFTALGGTVVATLAALGVVRTTMAAALAIIAGTIVMAGTTMAAPISMTATPAILMTTTAAGCTAKRVERGLVTGGTAITTASLIRASGNVDAAWSHKMRPNKTQAHAGLKCVRFNMRTSKWSSVRVFP